MSRHQPSCLACGERSNFFMRKDGFDEYLCPSCGHSFIFPLPQDEWLKDEVYSSKSGYQGSKTKNLAMASPGPYYGRILNHLVSLKPRGVLLDVGCSSGQFMHWARERGFSCKGVELNERTANIAKGNGLDVFIGFLSKASYEKKSFDIIYLGDVIEHVTNPGIFLDDCLDFLKPDGLLVISTPNVDCWWSRATLALYRMSGIPWSSATPPHHVSQFTIRSLDALLGQKGHSRIYEYFARPSSLRYELGSLHLWKRYKQGRRLRDLTFMIFAFSAYSVVYVINALSGIFLTKNFRWASFYRHI